MFKLNIQAKITFTFILIILVLLVLSSFVILPEIEKSLKEKSIENLENTVGFYAYDIFHVIEEQKNNIIVLSKDPVLADINVSKEDLVEQINITKEFHSGFEDITLVDNNGNVIVSTDYSYRGEWITNKWYQRALDGKTVVTDVYLILHPEKLVLSFLSPITKDDEVIRVIVGQVNFEKYWELLDEVVIGETGKLRLINNEGKIIFHDNKSKIFSKISLVKDGFINSEIPSETRIIDYGGKVNRIISYEHLMSELIYDNNGQWTLIAVQEVDEIFSTVNVLINNIISMSIFIFIIFITIGFFLSRGIVKPIKKLKSGLDNVARGDLDYKVNINSKDEIGQLASAFNQMAKDLKRSRMDIANYSKDLEKLLKQKDEFVNQLSHDLRTPLTPIVNLLPLLEKTEKDPKSKELFGVLRNSINRMKNIVTKTLKLAELNAPSTMFDMKDINLWEEAENSIKDQQLICDEKKFTVENKIDENIFVKADKLRLSEVFGNLISNAVKYSPLGGTITIDAHDDGDFVTVSIMDSGNGITSEQIDHIFDEFYKADESRHDLESSGLGRSICKLIVEKHGGRIWVESPGLGKGSMFYFTIPKRTSINIKNVSEEVDKMLKDIKNKEGER